MTSRKILLLGGLFLILLGITSNLFYLAFFIDNLHEQPLAEMKLVSQLTANDDLAQAYNHVEAAQEAFIKQKYIAESQIYALIFGTQTTIFGLLFDKVNLTEILKKILAGFMIMGGYIFPVGFLFQAMNFKLLGFLTTLTGGAWIILATIGFIIGVLLSTYPKTAK